MPARPSFRPSPSVIIGGLLLAVFGTTFATAADSKLEINACAAKSDGAVRLIDPGAKGTAGKCKKSERGVEWSMAGVRGPDGPIGPQGVPGSPGAEGPKGDPGPMGATGLVGPAGPVGSPGGGLRGATGPAGAPGPRGATGPAGGQGVRGATGPAGGQGARGATGPAGANGTFGGVAPTGLAQVGVINARRAALDGEWVEQPITFPAQIPGGVTGHVIGGPGNPGSQFCTGSPDNPTAAKGHLCVYIDVFSSYVSTVVPPALADPLKGTGIAQTKPYGTVLRAMSRGGDSNSAYGTGYGDTYLYGVWIAQN